VIHRMPPCSNAKRNRGGHEQSLQRQSQGLPPQQRRQELLDPIFNPKTGADLNILRIGVDGDSHIKPNHAGGCGARGSTCGSAASKFKWALFALGALVFLTTVPASERTNGAASSPVCVFQFQTN
jgi:hypothetical protein